MAHHVDRAIEALARKQHGAFSLEQVLQNGGDRRLANRRFTTGQWLRLDTGVYALPGNPATLLRQMKAAELAVPGAVVSGTAAAVLHGLPGVRVGRIELSAARHGGDTPLARVRHRGPVPTTVVAGIRATTVAQTLADLADSVDADVLGGAVDAMLLGRRTTWGDLDSAHQLARSRRARGARRFAEVLLARDPDTAVAESVLESKLYPLLDDPRLPPFVRQAVAPWDLDGTERVDATFPTVRWIVEADGRSWHARVADFERDRRRDHRALTFGWATFRFTAEHIDTPGYVVDVLLAALAHR